MPQSSEITIVMGADVVSEGTPVKGKVRLAYGNQGDKATYEDQAFEVTENGLLIFHFQVLKDLFWFEIRPESQMYLNYLAIYDGEWTAEQLGITANARQQVPRRATTTQTYTTDTNSYTLKDQNPKSRYICRVRAVGEEGTYSQWSEEKNFKFSNPAGVNSPIIDETLPQLIYDFQGRNLGTSTDALRKGIYIIGGKKVVK